jgi:FlaA1/EpsC-like NDP-sugar epimerase
MTMKPSLARLFGLPRTGKRWLMMLADAVMLPTALWSAYALRYADTFPPAMDRVWWLFLLLPVVGIAVFAQLGLYRAVVRFMGARAIWSVLAGALALGLVVYAAGALSNQYISRSVPIFFAALVFLYVGGTRFIVRAVYHFLLSSGSRSAEPVAIFGSGASGAQLAEVLRSAGRLRPVAFLDEDPRVWRSVIDGIPIYSPETLPKLIHQFRISRVLLAIPSASRDTRRRIISLLEDYPVYVQTVPPLNDIVEHRARLEEIRDIDIGDLLGRDPVPAVPELLERSIRDRVVLVTGAGGSIGSELCRTVLSQRPAKLILFEQNEFALYQVEQHLIQLAVQEGLADRLIPILGTVSSARQVKSVLSFFGVQTIYHAAAYKHVPMVERNLLQGIHNNVFGTRILAEAASDAGVERFVLISSDKAVRPTSVMGATKRLAELVLQDLAARGGKTVFTMVRFGNVLGSSGSVVPLFHRQIAEGGPVTVTHPEVTRYFMTVSEAAELVIQAGAMAGGGEVFVLDMGEPVRILDLARRMIRLHGLRPLDADQPEGDIAIQFTGLRPGEKLFEELLIGNVTSGTRHPKILRVDEDVLEPDLLQRTMTLLQQAVSILDAEYARDVLCAAIPEFQPEPGGVDWLALQPHPAVGSGSGDDVINLRERRMKLPP